MKARKGSFENELAQLIHKHHWEKVSHTPACILARMMVAAYHAFNEAIEGREMQESTDAAPARRERRNNP